MGEHFEPMRIDFQSPSTDGTLSGVSSGFPLWEARWTLSQAMSRAASEEWRAFIASLRGQQRTFLGYDHGRPYPLQYPDGFVGLARAGGGAFDGAAGSWALNTDRDVLTPSGLPAGLVLSIGDYGMLRWTTGGEARRSLHRLIEPSTATAGGVVGLTIEPPVPTLVPGSAVFDLAKPCCVMKQVTEKTQLSERGRMGKIGGTFAALQQLRA